MIFWMYELTKGEGVYQGCTGPKAESVMRQVRDGFDEAGEVFPVVKMPEGVTISPRRPWDDEDPTGCLESDMDFVLNNLDAAVALLEAALNKGE